MHSTDESTFARSNAEAREARLEFDRALVIVSDAGDASRIDDVLHQDPRHCGRQGFGLAATGASQNSAMPVSRTAADCSGLALSSARARRRARTLDTSDRSNDCGDRVFDVGRRLEAHGFLRQPGAEPALADAGDHGK